MTPVSLVSSVLPAARLEEALLRLCEEDSTSGREDALLPILLPILVGMGADVHLQPVSAGRTNVLATWGDPRVLFSTHLDTVPPFIPAYSDGSTVWGRGACDAKGQIVAQLAAIGRLTSQGAEGLAWLGVVGEETDSAGAREALTLKPRLANLRVLVNGEPTGNLLATGQRGVMHLRLCCQGGSAHSALPHLGRSAAWPMLGWLQRMQDLPLAQDAVLGAESWNLGKLQAGEAVNSVPAHAEADILARVVPGTRLEIQARETAPEGGAVEVLLSEPWDVYPRLEGFDYRAMPFGSDAPQLRELVADRTVVLAGPGTIEVAHTVKESISLEELVAGVDLNARLAKRFL